MSNFSNWDKLFRLVVFSCLGLDKFVNMGCRLVWSRFLGSCFLMLRIICKVLFVVVIVGLDLE